METMTANAGFGWQRRLYRINTVQEVGPAPYLHIKFVFVTAGFSSEHPA